MFCSSISPVPFCSVQVREHCVQEYVRRSRGVCGGIGEGLLLKLLLARGDKLVLNEAADNFGALLKRKQNNAK